MPFQTRREHNTEVQKPLNEMEKPGSYPLSAQENSFISKDTLNGHAESHILHRHQDTGAKNTLSRTTRRLSLRTPNEKHYLGVKQNRVSGGLFLVNNLPSLFPTDNLHSHSYKFVLSKMLLRNTLPDLTLKTTPGSR